MSKNLFIVFEGIDGSGKTTQAKLLAHYFDNIRLCSFNFSATESPWLTGEPTKGIEGDLLTSEGFLNDRAFCGNSEAINRQKMLLFAADRNRHFYGKNGILQRLENSHVICDRYKYSTFAYQVNNEKDLALYNATNGDFPDPDFTFWLDVPVDLAIKRIESREKRSVTDQEKIELENAQAGYDWLFTEFESKMIRIDASGNTSEVFSKITNSLPPFIDKSFLIS